MAARAVRAFLVLVTLISVALLVERGLPRTGRDERPAADPESPPRPVAVTVFDDDGRVVSEFTVVGRAFEPCPVAARDPATGNQVSALAPADLDSISLVLGETLLAGRAITEDGEPVAGARVLARSLSWPAGTVQTLAASTRTDAEGRFAVPVASATHQADIEVIGEGLYRRDHFQEVYFARPREIVVEPARIGDLEVLLERCGRPYAVGGVEVELMDRRIPRKAVSARGESSVTIPDVVRPESRSAGPVTILARSASAGLVGFALLPPAGAAVVSLQPAAPLRGRVLDETGRPAGGLAVSYYPGGLESATGPDGSFVIEATPEPFLAGEVSIATRARSGLLRLPACRFPEAPGGAIRMPIRGIEGRVVEDDGTPAEGARVYAGRSSLPDLRWVEPDTVADRDGRFTLFARAGSLPERLFIATERGMRDAICVVAGGEPLFVHLERTRVVRVTAIGPDGRPAPFASLSLHHAGTDASHRFLSDARGRFRLDGVWTRERTWISVHDLSLSWLCNEDLPEGEDDLDLVVRLDRSTPERTLAGRVVFRDGRPCRRAWVVVKSTRASEYDYRQTTTDEDGRFLVPYPPAPSLSIAVSDGSASGSSTPRGGVRFPGRTVFVETGVEEVPPIVVAGAPFVHGTVIDEHGRRLAGVACRLFVPVLTGGAPFTAGPSAAPSRHELTGTTDARGYYRIGVPREGLYHGRFSAGGHEAVEWMISTGRQGRVVFDPSAAVTGVVRDASGRPVPGVPLSFEWNERSPHDSEMVRTDITGRFECFVTPGSRVRIEVRDGLYDAPPVTVTSPSDVAILLRSR